LLDTAERVVAETRSLLDHQCRKRRYDIMRYDIMKWVALSSLVLAVSFTVGATSFRVAGSNASPAAVTGGRNRWLCAASIAGAITSVATGSVPGAIVSAAGISKFC
jgi:hypothetical protein